ncbi:Polyprenyl synthetase family protein [Planoprotostelium fungivorum]|uniref:Polyprenyl synthetase family protein n=1 Tax=Planoprotostelium fungivorum TaxID=1890364 RepID=A0A2P6NXU6_9EUKA|nr:Polyprenyl synthetase family protein [Planoprotostelium fungivorum]
MAGAPLALTDVFDPQLLRLVESTIEKWLPRRLDEKSYEELSPSQHYQADLAGINKAIFEPIWDLFDRGGKRWRAIFMILIAEALGHKAEDIMDFVVLPEIFHNGSLIIDDIEDDSGVRRGKPCIHLITGLDIAINAGNALYFLPLRILKSKRGIVPDHILLRCYEIYSQEMTNAHFGQGLDILWHSKHAGMERREPTVENYLYMSANKTGAVVKMCAKLSEEQMEALSQFVEAIGIAFQIQDDILNVTESNQLSINKGGVGEDIHEGKRTLMVIHCLQNAEEEKRKRLREILDMKTNDEGLIREAIDLLHSTQSTQFAREKALELVRTAWINVDGSLPDSAAKKKLKALSTYMIERQA